MKTGFVCDKQWGDLSPVDGERRFCGACSKVVHDLTGCTRQEARDVIRAAGGKACGRYRVDSRRMPVFAAVAGTLVAPVALADGAGAVPDVATVVEAEATPSTASVPEHVPEVTPDPDEFEFMMGDVVWTEVEERQYLDQSNLSVDAKTGEVPTTK